MTRVLVVDDKEENVYYLRALLSASGCEVDTASHGAEALVKARQTPPTIVVSDLLMPVMDGFTLLRHWKDDPLLKSVPFIVYTATYTEPQDADLALSMGADAFILKPVEPEEFLARLRAVEERFGNAAAPRVSEPVKDETCLLKEYSQSLIRKLEKKTQELVETNRLLHIDVAARRVVEAALRESEQRFRQLAENIDDVFWLTSAELSEVYYVSPAYETVWGRKCAELYASFRDWMQIVHPEDRQRLQASLSAYASGSWEQTYRIVRADGQVRSVRSRAYPVRDSQGNVYRVAGVSRDITEYHRLEEQFRQAQKMEAIGRLAGGIAHDFNNLLSVVMSYAGLALLDLPATDPAHGDLEQVQRAADRGADLTRQLLAFSRQQLLRPRALNLSDVVHEVEKMLGRVLGDDIELSIRTSGPTVVNADPGQMEQIIMNLAVNARDAMPRGGNLSIQVDCIDGDIGEDDAPEMPPGSYVRLTVTDTGAGMDEITRSRIFEPFFTTKARDKGTGLGLSTVFGIVKQSHGHVCVHSELGAGATFHVYLPRHEGLVRSPTPKLPAPEEVRGTEGILLVEDDEQVRTAIAAVLLRNGYQVMAVQCGDDALEASSAVTTPVHLLLTDVVMPRMSGPELAVRLMATHPNMKVLYISGSAEGNTLQDGASDTRVAFLQKPITPEALLRRVREVLAAPPVAAAPETG